MGFLVQVVDVADELDRVDDLLVVEQHTSDLAGVVSVVLLDDWVDGVTDFLTADLGLAFQGGEFGGVNEGLWLSTHELGGGAHAWGVLLVGLHAAWSSVVLSWATVVATSVVLAAASSITVLVTTTVLVAASAVVLVSTTVVVHAAASLVVVLSVSAGASLVVVAALATVVLLLSHVATLHLAAWATLLGALHVEVFHKVLLDLLETSLLTLGVKFGAWDPELDAQGSGTEWGGLVELLDGGFGALDVLVEDEVLSVGSGWVEVLTLSQLD